MEDKTNIKALIAIQKLSDVGELLKITTLVSVFLGFLYLQAYCSDQGVPLPLSLGELPTMLVAVAALAMWFVVFSFGFILFPLSGPFGGFGRGYRMLFPRGDKRSYATNWMHFSLSISLPIVVIELGVVLIFVSGWWKQEGNIVTAAFGVSAITIAIVWIAVGIARYPRYRCHQREPCEKKKKFTSLRRSSLSQMATYGFFWNFMIAWALAKMLNSLFGKSLGGSSGLAWSITGLLLMSIGAAFSFISIPQRSAHLGKGRKTVFVGFIFLVCFVSVTVRPASVFFGALALRALNIGGGSALSILAVAPDFPNLWKGKRLRLLLIAGDQMYVTTSPKEAGPVVAIKIPMEKVICFSFAQSKTDLGTSDQCQL